MRSKTGADIGSDHHLVVADVRIKIARIPSSTKSNKRNYDISKLQIPEYASEFRRNLYQRLEETKNPNLNREKSIDGQWEAFKKAYSIAAKEVLGFRKHAEKAWITPRTWALVEERRNAKIRIATEQTQETLSQYNALCKDVNRAMRRDYRSWANSLADEAESAAKRGNFRQLYSITKRLCNKQPPCTQPVKNTDGKLLVTEEEQLRRWREHFSSVLNRPFTSSSEYPENFWQGFPERTIDGISAEPPSVEEIVRAVRELKNNKAPGSDNIPAELLKTDPTAAAHFLQPLLNDVWQQEHLPADWKEGLLIKLPKKGNRTDCNNWRGITLLSTVSKVLSKIILYRIQGAIEDTIRGEQAGFRRGTSCVDQITSLRIIVEESVEWRKPLFMTFVDFEKAFDSINRQFIWDALMHKGVPEKIVNIIKEAYDGFNCRVVHNGKLTEPFNVTTGVRQGCLLSPLIFIVVMDAIMLKITHEKNRGIPWTASSSLEDLDFADDICLLSNTHDDMQRKITALDKTANMAGLKISRKKTEEMRVCSDKNPPLLLENHRITQAADFCYLGSIITPQGGTERDVESRINKARGAFSQLKSLWRSSNISRTTKIRIFNTNVKTVLLYGCETWKVTKGISHKLQVFVNNCLRTIIRRRWPDTITNVELWKVTNQKPIDIDIQERKWRWLGHTLRRPDDHIPKVALQWKPQGGSRRPGRPAHTWKRSIFSEAQEKGKSWPELNLLAHDREGWKRLVSAPDSSEE